MQPRWALVDLRLAVLPYHIYYLTIISSSILMRPLFIKGGEYITEHTIRARKEGSNSGVPPVDLLRRQLLIIRDNQLLNLSNIQDILSYVSLFISSLLGRRSTGSLHTFD